MYRMKRFAALLLAVVMVVSAVQITKVSVNASEDNSYLGNVAENENAQDYGTRATTVGSYIVEAGNQIMILSGKGSTGIYAHYFDKSYNHTSSVKIPSELPIFGGFYASGNNYYIVSGQNNDNESDSVEVIRITKYDKNWNRLGSCSLYGANTKQPFRAASVRMCMVGKYLVIRSGHQQYVSDDGLNHQTVITIQVDTDKMSIYNSCTIVGGFGYASHSFNQFAKAYDNKLYFVDHGDAYPRGIQLSSYNKDASDGSFDCTKSYYYDEAGKRETLLKFDGEIGNNSTGASIGGFEVSSKAFIIAGNQVVSGSSNIRDIFVLIKDKASGAVSKNVIADYSTATTGASTPQLANLGDDSFLLLWNYDGKVYYTKLDANGNKVGSTCSVEGSLSDCAPQMIDGRVTWYTYSKKSQLTFYSINPNDINDVKKTNKSSYAWKGNSSGWWLEYPDGSYAINTWLKVDGYWYYFNWSGYMASNEWVGGYWLGSNGAWTYEGVGSWHSDGYGWWYGDTSGWYASNCWQKIDGYWYYFDDSGYMVTNQRIDGYWIGADGVCR